MFDFHEKRKIKSFIYSKFSIGVILLLVILLSVSTFKRFSVEREMAEKQRVSEIELESLRERAAALESQVEHLENERGIEEELRSRFDVAKEGEQVVIILDNESNGSDLESLSAPPGGGDGEASFWSILKFW